MKVAFPFFEPAWKAAIASGTQTIVTSSISSSPPKPVRLPGSPTYSSFVTGYKGPPFEATPPASVIGPDAGRVVVATPGTGASSWIVFDCALTTLKAFWTPDFMVRLSNSSTGSFWPPFSPGFLVTVSLNVSAGGPCEASAISTSSWFPASPRSSATTLNAGSVPPVATGSAICALLLFASSPMRTT